MKITKYILSFTFLLVVLCAEAQQLRKEAFDLLNLDYPGLERVKAACDNNGMRLPKPYWTITANVPA